RRGDDVEVERGEVDAGGGTDAVEAATYDAERVLGGKQQHTAGTRDGEAAQARRARGDRDGDVEREERLAALGFATDDADGLDHRRRGLGDAGRRGGKERFESDIGLLVPVCVTRGSDRQVPAEVEHTSPKWFRDSVTLCRMSCRCPAKRL